MYYQGKQYITKIKEHDIDDYILELLELDDLYENADKEKVYKKVKLENVFKTNITNDYIPPKPLVRLMDKMKYATTLIICEIRDFFNEFPDFLNNKSNMYKNFHIPKKKGGLRKICAPKPQLNKLQKSILLYLQNALEIVPSNSAFAYVKNRSTIDMVKFLKKKENCCFIKIDLKNFFDSITKDLLYEKLEKIWNFKILKKYKVNDNMDLLDAIIELATKDDHLIQGSPLSPFLSNMVMIEFDYIIRKELSGKNDKKEEEIAKYLYARYADDMVFAAKKYKERNKVISLVDKILKNNYHNSIKRNKDKTQFVTNTSKCYITGVKINKDLKISFGHENKKELKSKLFNLFIRHEMNKNSIEEAQEILGLFNYMKQIEPNYANYLERKLLDKFNSNAPTIYKHFLGK